MAEIRRSHPAGNQVATQVKFDGDSVDTTLTQVRRRHLASLRCEPLDGGRHDPAYPERGRPSMPSDYGLTSDELLYEATRLHWQPWELRARLVDPKQVDS